MKIAYFSPWPPQLTGIADYSEQLVSLLAQKSDIQVFTDAISGTDRQNYAFPVRNIKQFQPTVANEFDIYLYQMGNNIAFHSNIYSILMRYPGVTTLHDLNLHSFLGEMYLKHNRFPLYVREMAYEYGTAGAHYARLLRYIKEPYDAHRYPIFSRVVNVSLGVVVHSRYSQRIISDRCPDTPSIYINQPVKVVHRNSFEMQRAKSKLGFQPNDILVASFGHIAKGKRIDVALKAISEIVEQFPSLHYLLVGQLEKGCEIESLVTKFELDKHVHILGYVDLATLRDSILATDVGINLRYPTNGETSATLLKLMAAGVPTVVSNVDAFAELPELSCIKITPGPDEGSQLKNVLRTLIETSSLRSKIGQYAQQFVASQCEPTHVAEQYISFLESVVSGQ